MKATETLKHEHVVIGKALEILAAMAAGVEAGTVPPEPDLRGVLAFFTDFADGCHHVKEETILFPALETAGLPRGRGPLAAMLDQHERGRRLVAAMRAAEPALARDPAARGRFASAAREYVSLLEQHITIENEVLFPGADRLLPAERDAEISAAFDRHEEVEMGPGVHQRFHRMLDELGARYR
ncbi:MAG TPA: hemerythrin domain-containing protein [Gemmatimonadales bacterium]|nr:hemerythrin domain-containing protein [Gemmatimonadales bacterium]